MKITFDLNLASPADRAFADRLMSAAKPGPPPGLQIANSQSEDEGVTIWTPAKAEAAALEAVNLADPAEKVTVESTDEGPTADKPKRGRPKGSKNKKAEAETPDPVVLPEPAKIDPVEIATEEPPQTDDVKALTKSLRKRMIDATQLPGCTMEGLTSTLKEATGQERLAGLSADKLAAAVKAVDAYIEANREAPEPAAEDDEPELSIPV
jgi:hypothetical protein